MIFAIIFAEIFFLFERKNAIIKNRRLCDEIRWKSPKFDSYTFLEM